MQIEVEPRAASAPPHGKHLARPPEDQACYSEEKKKQGCECHYRGTSSPHQQVCMQLMDGPGEIVLLTPHRKNLASVRIDIYADVFAQFFRTEERPERTIAARGKSKSSNLV